MINILELFPGDKIRLDGDIIAEVTSNPRDGVWIQARFVKVPSDPSLEGEEEMIFAEDILELVTTNGVRLHWLSLGEEH